MESARSSLAPPDRLVAPETSRALPADPGLLPSPSILLIPNAHRSRCDDDPYDELGDGSGWDPVMKTDSDLGVWFPPRPREGGTPN